MLQKAPTAEQALNQIQFKEVTHRSALSRYTLSFFSDQDWSLNFVVEKHLVSISETISIKGSDW